MLSGLSVVVPTHQRAAVLPRVLAPLLADPALDELIVVVDGSDDGSLELLTALSAQDPRLRPLWQPNSGAGAARQRGVEQARGDVVLLLDDDVLARPGLVTGHAEEHRRQPGRVVLGSMPVEPVLRRTAADVTTVLYSKDYEHACREFSQQPERILEGFWSGNVSLPTVLAREVGLGDPDLADLFPSEDRELGLRLRARGVQAVFRPELAAVHLHRRTLARFVDDSRRQGRARHVLHRRHPDVVPAPTGAMLAGRLPPPARWLVTSARRSALAGRLAGAACRLLVQALGAVRWWRAQDVAIVVLQRVELANGARTGDRCG